MTIKEKPATSCVVKVTGMSPELIALLDARVREQHAAGRAEYVRELIRRDVLSRRPLPAAPSGQEMLAEYHLLADRKLDGRLSSAEQTRLQELEEAMDREEAQAPETQMMFARMEGAMSKLDALLAAVQALPKSQAGE